MRTKFPEFIYEAIVTEVDYVRGVCSLSPLNPNLSYQINDVIIPYIAGNGNSGIWKGLHTGSRVIVANTSGEGEEFAVILGYLPKQNLNSNNFANKKPQGTPSGTIAYPSMAEGRMVLRGDNGAEIILSEYGDLSFTTIGGAGTRIRRDGDTSALYNSIQNYAQYTNAGKSFSGIARRASSAQRGLFPLPNLSDVPLFADINYHKVGDSIGLFNNSSVYKFSLLKKKRNPELAETRFIINEFSTESMFTGFDDEYLRFIGQKALYENSETSSRNRELSNSLSLAEHELIEFVGGNLIDPTGNILDINYNKVLYSFYNNKVPQKNIEEEFEKVRRTSRRGVGLHLGLSTNKKSTDIPTNQNTFTVDIDKEGLLKLNVPASTDTGNIPYSSFTNFGADGVPETSSANETKSEPIPVTLRDEFGNQVLPKQSSKLSRQTGIRFSNTESSPYFSSSSSSSGSVRVNTTKHHNMYAIAERLIANSIKSIEIPQTFVKDDGTIEQLAIGKPFEIVDPENEENETSDVYPSYMSVVTVLPEESAIYTGGDTVVAGQVYAEDEEIYPPFSNSFIVKKDGNSLNASNTDESGTARINSGGKSAHLNFEGCVETSIGKDNYDQKSFVLDTAGSILAWAGKDRNGRSMVMQSDGDVLLNVGGTYDSGVMNKGKFVLRVNVTDKKFSSSIFDGDSDLSNIDGANPGADSDFIIHISEEGLVIAGMKAGAPMVIRNDGKILIESTSNDVVLKGLEVKTVESKGKAKTVRSAGKD